MLEIHQILLDILLTHQSQKVLPLFRLLADELSCETVDNNFDVALLLDGFYGYIKYEGEGVKKYLSLYSAVFESNGNWRDRKGRETHIKCSHSHFCIDLVYPHFWISSARLPSGLNEHSRTH